MWHVPVVHVLHGNRMNALKILLSLRGCRFAQSQWMNGYIRRICTACMYWTTKEFRKLKFRTHIEIGGGTRRLFDVCQNCISTFSIFLSEICRRVECNSRWSHISSFVWCHGCQNLWWQSFVRNFHTQRKFGRCFASTFFTHFAQFGAGKV